MIINVFDRLAPRLGGLREQRIATLLTHAGDSLDTAVTAADLLTLHLSPGPRRRPVDDRATVAHDHARDLHHANEDVVANVAVAIAQLHDCNPLTVIASASRHVPPRIAPTLSRELLIAPDSVSRLVTATAQLLDGHTESAVSTLEELLAGTLIVLTNTASLHEASHPGPTDAPTNAA
jgi:hypothetical protein